MSETVRVSSQVAADSFVTFARKVIMLCGSGVLGSKDLNVKEMVQLDIRFHGGQFNQTMASTIKAMQLSLLTSDHCMTTLQELDRVHGQEVLTGSYNKIKLFLSTCNNDNLTCAWVLDQIITALDRKEVGKGDFLLETYKKTRNGSANFVQMAIATKLMVEHCETIVEGLRGVDEALAEKLQEGQVPNEQGRSRRQRGQAG